MRNYQSSGQCDHLQRTQQCRYCCMGCCCSSLRWIGRRACFYWIWSCLSLWVAPLDLQQGGNSRIPYVHVPAARMSMHKISRFNGIFYPGLRRNYQTYSIPLTLGANGSSFQTKANISIESKANLNRRTTEPLGPSSTPGCDESTSRCQMTLSIRALGRNLIGKDKLGFLQRYKELQDIIAILGLDELSEEDRLLVARARTTGESSLPKCELQTTDFGSGTRTYFRYSGFLLSVAKSRLMIKSAKCSLTYGRPSNKKRNQWDYFKLFKWAGDEKETFEISNKFQKSLPAGKEAIGCKWIYKIKPLLTLKKQGHLTFLNSGFEITAYIPGIGRS
ncbi:hypothetical protein HAX54_045840 [Datura stramonium]|uniref:Uncharacterized protein n=1 Tax=Datura stramonium TaxID=4076 RepID=A0ABS8WGD0_DATST|nr:hypothetical protein [Datura stramonium]